MDDVTGIIAMAVAGVAFVGTLVARWNETNPTAKWYVRLARVFDVTQVLDSTRTLGE